METVKAMKATLSQEPLPTTMDNVFGQNYVASPEGIQFANFEDLMPKLR